MAFPNVMIILYGFLFYTLKQAFWKTIIHSPPIFILINLFVEVNFCTFFFLSFLKNILLIFFAHPSNSKINKNDKKKNIKDQIKLKKNKQLFEEHFVKIILKYWYYYFFNLFMICKNVFCNYILTKILESKPIYILDNNDLKIKLQIQREILLQLNSFKKMPKHELIEIIKFEINQSYPFFKNLFLIEAIVEIVLENNSKLFMIQNEFLENGKEVEFIILHKFMNIFVKNESTNNELHCFHFHPSQKIHHLIRLLTKIYPNGFKNLTFASKSLIMNENLSFFDFGIQEGSTLQLTIESLDGGAPDEFVKCRSCDCLYPPGYLCPHGNCKNHRLNCNCCLHNNCSERCAHGNCTTCFDRIKSTVKNMCQCVEAHKRDRVRDYSSKRFPRGQKNPQSKKKETYPQFPIITHGNRETFFYLNDFDWCSLQCLLFWDFCEKNNKLIYPSETRKLFLKKEFEIIFDQTSEQKLRENFLNKKITVNNFLYGLHSPNNNNNFENNIDKLINPLIVCYNQSENTNFLNFLNRVIDKIVLENTALLNDFPIPPDLILFSTEILQSFTQSFEVIQNDVNSKPREKTNLIIQALSLMLYGNKTVISCKQLSDILKISPYCVGEAKTHIEKMKSGEFTNFKRVLKKKNYYSPETINLITTFWNIFTIPSSKGKKPAKKYISKLKKSIEKNIRYIPCTIVEFYINFCENDEFGKQCTTTKGKYKIPKLTFFLKHRPFYVRPLEGFKTGVCCICLEMKAHLKTFVKLLRKHCDCKNLNCKTFVHKDSCVQQDVGGTCLQCPRCFCDHCSACKVSVLDFSASNFMKILNCQIFHRGGRPYPNWDCLVNCCSSCKIADEFELLRMMCPSALAKIDLDSEVTAKLWAKESVEKIRQSGVSKKFDVPVLEPTKMPVREFLKLFFDKLTTKRGYRWHHHMCHFQRFQYNTMIRNFQKGVYLETTAMFVVDYAEDYRLCGREITSDQYYHAKQTQILGIVEFFFFKRLFHGVSQFILSNQDSPKSSENCIDELKKRILARRQQNHHLKVVHVFSDGSTKEFLNKNVFWGLKDFAKSLQIRLVWHYFANNHGKNICDSEFSRYKRKLDRVVSESQTLLFRSAGEVFLYSKRYLLSSIWPANGNQIRSREYSWRSHEDNMPSFECKYSRVKDTKLYRSCFWDLDGTFYRRRGSCSCKNCVENPSLINSCLNFTTLTGSWEPFIPPKSRKKTKTELDSHTAQSLPKEESDTVESCSEEDSFESEVSEESLDSDFQVWMDEEPSD